MLCNKCASFRVNYFEFHTRDFDPTVPTADQLADPAKWLFLRQSVGAVLKLPPTTLDNDGHWPSVLSVTKRLLQ